MGIIRTTLVLGTIIAVMPSPPQVAGTQTIATGAEPGTFGYVMAAAEAFSDVKGFCLRKPFVCEAAGQMAVKIEGKAKYSAKLIYEWANEATTDTSPVDKVKDLDSISTGSVDAIISPETSPNRET